MLNSFLATILLLGTGAFCARTSKYSSSHQSLETTPLQQPQLNATANATCSGSLSAECPFNGLNLKQLSIDMIRNDILRKLHLDENNLPNITTNNFPIPTSYLNGFINIQNDEGLDSEEDEVVTEKIIAFSRGEQVNLRVPKPAHYFTFSERLSTMRIESALLHVLVKFNNGTRKVPEFKIKLFEILKHSTKGGDSLISLSHGSLKPHTATNEHRHNTQHPRWINVDITPILKKSLEKYDKKIGFVIEAVDSNNMVSNEVQIISSVGDHSVDINNPFIELRVSEKPLHRLSRSPGIECTENSLETRCCRFPLIVDFEEFGWDWIIAPKKYDANYCSGECPFAFMQKYPHNHIIQQANPGGIGGPCCAARKMSSITMLYFDRESNIVLSVLNGMVVDKCGCS